MSEIQLFVGDDYVVTIAHGRNDLVEQLRADTERLGATSPRGVLHAVVDQVVDGYLGVVRVLEDEVQEIERQVFSQVEAGDVAPRIYDLKREVLELWHNSEPLIVPLETLAKRGDDQDASGPTSVTSPTTFVTPCRVWNACATS